MHHHTNSTPTNLHPLYPHQLRPPLHPCQHQAHSTHPRAHPSPPQQASSTPSRSAPLIQCEHTPQRAWFRVLHICLCLQDAPMYPELHSAKPMLAAPLNLRNSSPTSKGSRSLLSIGFHPPNSSHSNGLLPPQNPPIHPSPPQRAPPRGPAHLSLPPGRGTAL